MQLRPRLMVTALFFQSFIAAAQTNNAIDPQYVGRIEEFIIGAVGNKIYQQLGYEGKWMYWFTLPFSADSGSLYLRDSNTVMFNQYKDTTYFYTISDGGVTKRSRAEMMKHFCNSEISQIAFSKIISGCFQYDWNEIVYEQVNGAFVLTQKKASDSKKQSLIKSDVETLDQQKIEAFAKSIAGMAERPITMDDFGFTRQDYETCKQDIQQFKVKRANSSKSQRDQERDFVFYKNNTDFDRLTSLVDSIRLNTVKEDAFVYLIINTTLPTSTTSEWVKIKLVNALGDSLEMYGRYPLPGDCYIDWHLYTGGIKSSISTMEINSFLAGVFPPLAGKLNRKKLLHEFVQLLYDADHYR